MDKECERDLRGREWRNDKNKQTRYEKDDKKKKDVSYPTKRRLEKRQQI